MPELVAIYLIGATFVFISVNINLWFVHRQFHSLKFSTLNHNLSLVKQYWSMERNQKILIPENSSQELLKKKDYQKTTRSAFIFGSFMIFLSWFGLLFFMIYLFSVHRLARSRFEQKIFASPLVITQLSNSDDVQKLLTELTEP
jgi:hypothetical protein